MDMNIVLQIGGVIAVFLVLRTVLMSGAKKISGAEARKMVADGALLVDVRTPQEFAQGKIKGSKNIPLQAMGNRMKEFGKTDQPIVLCCKSGTRSAMAARTLKSAGYKNLYNLGAWNNWG